MPEPLVERRRHRGVETVWLASPHNRNALSIQLLEELSATVRECRDDPDCRGLVLDHRGPVFCAGVDLVERRSLPPGSPDHSELLTELLKELWAYPDPLLCRVGGAVRGGGMGLVTCADVVVAGEDASFAYTEVRVGVAPALVGALALAKVGGPLAHWMLTGRTFGPAEAAALGLVTHLGEGDGAAALEGLLDDIGRGAPEALRVTKRLARDLLPTDASDLLDDMRDLSSRLFQTEEAKEGMAAFAERRPPSWVPPAP